MIYPSTGGRPKARRMTTDMTTDQQGLYDLFDLTRWAPKQATEVIGNRAPRTTSDQHKQYPRSTYPGKSR
jgi:hypothetical protein